MKAQNCWTDNISNFPCQARDNGCWGQILPESLPCKDDDKKCWKDFIKDDGKKKYQDTKMGGKPNHEL